MGQALIAKELFSEQYASRILDRGRQDRRDRFIGLRARQLGTRRPDPCEANKCQQEAEFPVPDRRSNWR